MNEPGWKVASASVRGSSHEKSGQPCQDANAWTVLPGDLLVAAVSDGAGSAPLAEVGATIASNGAVKHTAKRLKDALSPEAWDDTQWDEMLLESVAAARSDLEAEAVIRGVPVNHFATTLILLVAGEKFVASVQIGDGATVAAESEETMVCLGRANRGEYLNETSFLTSPGLPADIHPVVWRGTAAHVAMISDGLEMASLRMPQGEPHPGFFGPLFRFMRTEQNGSDSSAGLVEFLESPRLRTRTDDDVTLLLASFTQ